MNQVEYLATVIDIVNAAFQPIGNNSQWVISWSDRMMKKTGLCGVVLCEALAEYCEESGNEEPSRYAIGIAVCWERSPHQLIEYIEKSHKWCKGTLSWGCINLCKIWQQENWDKLKKRESNGK
jgi:hypothetical protein